MLVRRLETFQIYAAGMFFVHNRPGWPIYVVDGWSYYIWASHGFKTMVGTVMYGMCLITLMIVIIGIR